MTTETADGRGSWPGRLLWLVVIVGVTVAVAVWIGRRRTERATDRLVATLLAGADNDGIAPARTVIAADREGLPDPVRRYVDTVVDEGQPFVRTARLEQRGEFRLGEGANAWKPLTAVQHFAVDPPGFVWDARIDVLPGLPARVVDYYVNGEGALWGRLLSVLPVVEASSGPGMNEGELLRYLGECVWFPTALLDERVEWEPVDDSSARATIDDGGTTATLVFHFDDRDLVERVHTDRRYRQETADRVPWTGHFRDYRVRNGVLVPTEAEVEWDADDGSYWRASVESVEYGVGSPSHGEVHP